MAALTHYLESILTPFLQVHGVSQNFIAYTVETIERQATSLLQNWEDLSFRKTVLTLGSEEGTFYEPAGKFDVKCFVVAAIRNSPIETIQSTSFQKAGLMNALSDSDVKAITSGAIRYFNAQDFTALYREAKKSAKPNYYRDTAEKYPVAWSALRHLACAQAKVVEYESVPFDTPYQLNGRAQEPAPAGEKEAVQKVESIFDAYSPEMDPALIGMLYELAAEPRSVFVVDSFKAAGRNFENVLKILEFLLTRDAAFATSNYFLENGHVERRIKLLRAAHTVSQMEENLSQLSGLGRKHAAALKSLNRQS